MRAPQSLCGDATCQSYGCTQAAIDAWYQQQEETARQIVRLLLVPASVGGVAQ